VEGSGLGLAIAKWIADMHQARLSVESRESAGSTFRIVFPASAADSSSAWAPGSEDRAARMAARE
jgi:signal transduction histidine kinase